MRRLLLSATLATALLALSSAPAAADFGLKDLDGFFIAEDGSPSMQAGSHPFAATAKLSVNTEVDPELGEVPDGQIRDLLIELPPGLVGAPTATPRCEGVDFAKIRLVQGMPLPECPTGSAVGIVEVHAASSQGLEIFTDAPLFSIVPPPGVAARVGFAPFGAAPVTTDFHIEETPPYNVITSSTNITQTARFFGAEATLWGNPSDPSHDEERGICGAFFEQAGIPSEPIGGLCPSPNPNIPFVTLPSSCSGPLATFFEATSWLGELSAPPPIFTHDDFEELGINGCAKLGFAPKLAVQPTARSAASPTGLDFNLDFEDPGLANPEGVANSTMKKVEITLPEGVTLNPSQAEGLGVCGEADFARESAASPFGAGCPASSKVGTVEAESPLLDDAILKGSLFVATPHENPFDTLIALYMTVKSPRYGLSFRLAGKVIPDPQTGQLRAIFGEPGHELPEIAHISHLRAHLREGARSPLITPSLCGTYETEVIFTTWANPQSPVTKTSPFTVNSGVGGGACPPPGTPPFDPGFQAGTFNNNAGSHSPFYGRLTRRDGDQDLTKLSVALPPGMIATLAGVSRCPEERIALAKSKSGIDELTAPSCPANSQIGRLIAGAGVGAQLLYVSGEIYLAGPYQGAPLSIVEVVPAVGGPFDVGTVVVRQALQINPRTAKVRVDGDRSDPIPHILAGIPLGVRDIQVFVDRPNFTLNPTSCDPFQISATMWGGGADAFSTADDSPVNRDARFQAANCANLAFKPSLSLKLNGGTKRGDHPALRAVVKPRPRDANIAGAVVRLPRSAFLEQAHIRTICTRVQFAADDCPKGAVYGHVRAFTPILDEPLEGPVYLRSSNHNLPDLVFDLHGLVDFEAVGRIDSKRGGIRTTFTEVPDAPISKVVLRMQGGKKGLIVNSTDLCKAPHRVNARFDAHNGKSATLRPALRASCGK